MLKHFISSLTYLERYVIAQLRQKAIYFSFKQCDEQMLADPINDIDCASIAVFDNTCKAFSLGLLGCLYNGVPNLVANEANGGKRFGERVYEVS